MKKPHSLLAGRVELRSVLCGKNNNGRWFKLKVTNGRYSNQQFTETCESNSKIIWRILKFRIYLNNLNSTLLGINTQIIVVYPSVVQPLLNYMWCENEMVFFYSFQEWKPLSLVIFSFQKRIKWEKCSKADPYDSVIFMPKLFLSILNSQTSLKTSIGNIA